MNISDQTGELPVISMGQSRDANGKPLNYQDGMTSFYSRLYNKASLMKFNVTTPSEAAICITGMNNTVTVNFGQPTEDNYGFSYGKDDAGLIMMAGQEGTGEKTYWAIVLPQAELAEGTEGSVYSFDEAYVGTRPAIHAIEVNKFYHEGEDVITMEVSTVVNPLFIPLTFQARTAGVTIGINISSLEYSINGGEWTSYNSSITLDNVGDIVSFRVLSTQEYLNNNSFSCTGGQCYIYGNVMSLLRSTDYATNFTLQRGDTFSNLFSGNANIDIHPNKDLVLPSTELKSNCYSSMFNGCTGLTKAPVLPATSLAEACYSGMFEGCTGLTTAPDLPATTLAIGCYSSMFYGCTGLTTAPELPAKTLVDGCYSSMFSGCSSLNSITCLATTGIDENYSTDSWVDGVASTGTFSKASGANWGDPGINGIPSGWEVVTLLPEGALSGLFSIADGYQVYFSKGNLQYIGSATTPYWKFADHQWDILGDNGQTGDGANIDRDLFGWGTSGYNNYQPYCTSTNNYSYYNGHLTGTYDWGYNAISNGGNQQESGWRLPNRFEWDYLIVRRNNASSKYGFGEVNNVKGMILLPDEWTLPDGLTFTSGNSSTNVYTEGQWNQMESHGAVFLPAAGYRSGNYYELNTQGRYWSSTFRSPESGFNLSFGSGYWEDPTSNYVSNGISVRLIRDL